MRINVPIAAKDKYCQFCAYRSEKDKRCGIFLGEETPRDKETGWLLRCADCLDAEVADYSKYPGEVVGIVKNIDKIISILNKKEEK